MKTNMLTLFIYTPPKPINWRIPGRYQPSNPSLSEIACCINLRNVCVYLFISFTLRTQETNLLFSSLYLPDNVLVCVILQSPAGVISNRGIYNYKSLPYRRDAVVYMYTICYTTNTTKTPPPNLPVIIRKECSFLEKWKRNLYCTS